MGRKIQGPQNFVLRYTCSPGDVRKYLKQLSPQQKDYVRKIGFGSFLYMADFELDKDLTLWLFHRFNCTTECLEFEGGISIPVRPLVKSVLGIPSGPLKVVDCSRYFDPDMYHRYYVGNVDSRCRRDTIEKGSKYIHAAGKQICSETEEKHFCIAFMMAIIGLYLAPNKNSITCKPFFGAVQQVDKLTQMDWCDFTATYLFEGIREFKQHNWSRIKVQGCVHILSVIFIDLVKNGALKIPGGFPRICFITSQHQDLVNSCYPQVHRLEESVYASVLDKIPKTCFTFGISQRRYFAEHRMIHHRKYQFRRIARKCADSDANTDAGAYQFSKTVEDTTCNSTKLMETHERYRSVLYYSRATRSHKEPEDPLKYGRSILGASQKKHPISAELDTAISSPNTLSLAIVEPPELDTSTPSAEPASHEDSHSRQESLITATNADSTHHHSVEQEHINFPRDGQQLLSNGPSSESYATQNTEGVQIAPDVSLRRNRASPSTMEEGDRRAKKARAEQPSDQVEPAGGGAIVDTSLLNCPLCSRPFKPPVFQFVQCKGGHLACGTCIAELPIIQCQKCEHGGAFDIHNIMMDTIVLSAKVKCSHAGCQSYVIYHELHDHESTCPCAPCFCTEPGCSFVGLPLALLSHLTTQHSWPIHSIEYGKELRLQVPVLEPRHLLLGEEDDCVFLLVMGAAGQSTATSVSAVRLGACLALQPRYMLNILAYLPPAVASRRAHMLLLDMDVESSTRPGEVAVEELPSYLTVPPTYLVGAGASKEVVFQSRSGIWLFCCS
ncbi:uncharacterized protein LOC124667005 isoform X3 [Lolium rigidum]|uniref:uncharacterized protein LOC124667005 isoform X3 n=1 Tax=Lolium rigidum TaxID=89674 RepID=UPI001F5DA16C|nr:uncharacterized protein LOC124667005 isoform X3 [Lolium rigidum]